MNKFFPSGIQTQNNNIDSQTFDPNLTHNVSMVAGFDGVHENLAIVDSAGNLHVNSAASSYLHTFATGVITSNGSSSPILITFPVNVSLIYMYSVNGYADIMIYDTVKNSWGTNFPLGSSLVAFPVVTNQIQVYSDNPSVTVTIHIIAFY